MLATIGERLPYYELRGLTTPKGTARIWAAVIQANFLALEGALTKYQVPTEVTSEVLVNELYKLLKEDTDAST